MVVELTQKAATTTEKMAGIIAIIGENLHQLHPYIQYLHQEKNRYINAQIRQEVPHSLTGHVVQLFKQPNKNLLMIMRLSIQVTPHKLSA